MKQYLSTHFGAHLFYVVAVLKRKDSFFFGEKSSNDLEKIVSSFYNLYKFIESKKIIICIFLKRKEFLWKIHGDEWQSLRSVYSCRLCLLPTCSQNFKPEILKGSSSRYVFPCFVSNIVLRENVLLCLLKSIYKTVVFDDQSHEMH